ncbi:DUF167 domain-containing protein [Candidatus Saccharibacteria bacterium]|nr:DUF167 domain-containing protein [Candidatus Saccharibacteria bacterium]
MKTVQVRVKPGSKKGQMVQAALDGSLLVYLREPAVDGQANAALIKILAEHFGVSKSQVRIVQGRTSRTKVVEVN